MRSRFALLVIPLVVAGCSSGGSDYPDPTGVDAVFAREVAAAHLPFDGAAPAWQRAASSTCGALETGVPVEDVYREAMLHLEFTSGQAEEFVRASSIAYCPDAL